MSTLKFKITNLTCEACIKLSTMVLETIPGVSQIKITLTTGDAELVSDREISWDQIYSVLQSVGKHAIQLP